MQGNVSPTKQIFFTQIKNKNNEKQKNKTLVTEDDDDNNGNDDSRRLGTNKKCREITRNKSKEN